VTPTARTRTNLPHWLTLAAALVLLNASLTFGNVWPTPKIAWRAALSIELAAVMVLVMATHAWPGSSRRRWLGWLAGLWLVLVIGHYADITAFGLYGRDINLYWDARHLTNVASMLAGATPLWVMGAALGATTLLLGAMFIVTRWALGRVADGAARPDSRAALSVIVVTIAALCVWQFATRSPTDTDDRDDLFAAPVTPAFVRQARLALGVISPGTGLLAASPELDVPLTGLGQADVLLTFVESYGAVTYDRPDIAVELETPRSALEAAARETNRSIVSAYVRSPTFGGSSWLAHLSLLSGVEVRDGYAHALLMTQPRDTVVGTFARAGYRTVAMMPGLRQDWPEGAFYHFDRIIGFDELDWTGPRFGWWTIPDQFTLARLDALERPSGPRPPVFAFFPTGTSHAPFGPIPPYQSDWRRVLSAEPFAAPDIERAQAQQPRLANLGPGYTRAIAYEFETLAGYLHENALDDLVVLVAGDHQPPAAVSGAGASWDVPVHVIASSDALLRRFVAHGFRRGMEPVRPAVAGMDGLLTIMLDAFSAPDDATRPPE
jgi:hypothetical protein